MFVKIDGSYINLDLVHSIDVDDDGTATLWFTGVDGLCRDVTADDLKVIEAAIRHECVFEEIEQPSPCLEVDLCEMGELKAHNINDLPLHDIANCDFYLKSEAAKVIAEKDTEIRRLKRALWLDRAERYKMREFIAREEGNLSNQMSWSRILRERTYDQWVGQLLRIANLANKLQNKCRAKAEEYK